jgi:hypothetical protein
MSRASSAAAPQRVQMGRKPTPLSGAMECLWPLPLVAGASVGPEPRPGAGGDGVGLSDSPGGRGSQTTFHEVRYDDAGRELAGGVGIEAQCGHTSECGVEDRPLAQPRRRHLGLPMFGMGARTPVGSWRRKKTCGATVRTWECLE